MCGRFACAIPISSIKKYFEAKSVYGELPPNFNVAPTQDIMTVVQDESRNLQIMNWGLVPTWARHKSTPPKPLINARSETIQEKPSFKNAFKQRRCLIIADGFYEWKVEGKEKHPFYTKLSSGDPMAFAGIYEKYVAEDKSEILSCAILTTDANTKFEEIHNRMPVIIQKPDIDLWFDLKAEPQHIVPLFKPVPDDIIEFYEVSMQVNTPKNNNPELIQPI